jgi:hypothetical protein
VQEKRPQLNGYWSIIKNDTQFHKLKLNDDYENPVLLIQGWNKIKAFHNLPDNVQIEFLYYGNKTFEIASSKKIKSMDEISPFHSRSMHPTCTTIINVELTPTNIDVPKLVSRSRLLILLFISIYKIRYLFQGHVFIFRNCNLIWLLSSKTVGLPVCTCVEIMDKNGSLEC